MASLQCSQLYVLGQKSICILSIASKIWPLGIIGIILTILNNEQHTCKRIIVDEDDTLEKPSDVTDILVDKFNIALDTTGGDASWLNGKNKLHNRIIYKMVISCLIVSNQNENKWCCASETYAEVDSSKIHSVMGNTLLFLVWWTTQYEWTQSIWILHISRHTKTQEIRQQNTIRIIYGLYQHQINNEIVGFTHQETQILIICKINEHNNNFDRGWSPSSNMLKFIDK